MSGNEILTLLSNNVTAITSTVGAVAGALFTAIFLRHDTSLKEFERIKAGKFNEVIDDLLKSGKMTYTELYKAKNFLSIAEKADYHFSQMSPTEIIEPYDFDWFMRFYEAVGCISDEDMQEIWAKILAGEIVKPTSFSLKAIDILRNISKKDAELFMKVCKNSYYVNLDRVFLPNIKSYLEKVDVQYEEIMKLNELGLIFCDSRIALEPIIGVEPEILFVSKNLVMTIASSDGKERKTQIPQYPFTEVGSELARVVGDIALDDSFILFGEQLVKENNDYKVSVHKILSMEGDIIEPDKTNLLDE